MLLCWHKIPTRRPAFNLILEQLHSLIIEVAIRYSDLQQFWARNWLDKEVVSWSPFAINFYQLAGVSLPSNANRNKTYNCLRLLLASSHQDFYGPDSEEMVEIERVGMVFDAFLPTLSSEGALAHQFLKTVRRISTYPWFFGCLSRKQADDILQYQPPGTFLVRITTRNKETSDIQPFGCFAISSYSSSGTITHSRIHHSPELGFSLVAPPGPNQDMCHTVIGSSNRQSLRSFIQSNSDILNLRAAAPNSPFFSICVPDMGESFYIDDQISNEMMD